MRLRKYAVTVMDGWTPMRLFWTREGALRWRDKIGLHAHAYKWTGGVAAGLLAAVIAAAAGGFAKHEPQPDLPAPGPAGWNLEQLLPISPAYGAEVSVIPQASQSNDPFVKGLNLFLYGPNPRYRLVVHSVLDDKAKAETVAKRLNKNFKLPAEATVGERKPNNPYWPIVLNGWTTYDEAKKLKDEIKGMDFGFDSDDNPYISVDNR